MKKLLLIALLYNSVVFAQPKDIVIINQPNGGQTVCIVLNGVVTCY